MEILTILLLVVLIITVIWLASKKPSNQNGEQLSAMMERLSYLSEQNHQLRLTLDQKLSETHRANQEQFGQTSKIFQNISKESSLLFADVTEKLTKLDETNRQVVNFSAQLQSLQDILKNPKQRGVLGEYFLEETLKNVLPPNSYQMQYKFKNGEIVDAVVFVKEKIIPIDSKFSLENYEKLLTAKGEDQREKISKLFKQDLKNRIDETSKYIRPSEDTMDFAFMFIPSEAIYYDLLTSKVAEGNINSRDLIEYAFNEKHVIIISPTSFLAYLQTVLQGLRALQIEESAKAIRDNVAKLGRHIQAYDEYYKKLGTSLSTTINHYNAGYKEFNKIDKDVTKITGEKSELEILELDRPNTD